MALQANSSGVITGKFTIPANVPVGAKRVEFVGAGGSRGESTFVGEGTIFAETRQTINTVTTSFWQRSVDPLAQTFTLTENRQAAAVDLWFTAKGTSDVIVQIRETATGFPTRVVLAEGRVTSAAITVGQPNPTRITFNRPVLLQSGVEYALVVLCDDADTALAIAELGKWDSTNNRWVTSQPYQVGVLLSSSNASTWTPHQDKDMAFRLMAATYTQDSRTVELGKVAVSNATDLMVLPLVETAAASSRAAFRLTLPDGTSQLVGDGQPVRLASPITGNVAVDALIGGSSAASPVLWPGTQVVSGAVSPAATYVTLAIPAGQSVRARCLFEALLPAGASVTVDVRGIDAGDSWVTVPFLSSSQAGDGWFELVYELSGVNEDAVQFRLTLTGNTGNSAVRPRVRKLRALTVA